MVFREMANLMEGTDLIPFVRWERNAMGQVENLHSGADKPPDSAGRASLNSEVDEESQHCPEDIGQSVRYTRVPAGDQALEDLVGQTESCAQKKCREDPGKPLTAVLRKKLHPEDTEGCVCRNVHEVLDAWFDFQQNSKMTGCRAHRDSGKESKKGHIGNYQGYLPGPGSAGSHRGCQGMLLTIRGPRTLVAQSGNFFQSSIFFWYLGLEGLKSGRSSMRFR